MDLSIGTPVDPVPDAIRDALAAASDAPGYPLTAGTPALRAAITRWVARSCRASGSFGVLPTIGSKELVAWLPTLLGIGPGDVVAIPEVCYPTYEVGAKLVGAGVVRYGTGGPANAAAMPGSATASGVPAAAAAAAAAAAVPASVTVAAAAAAVVPAAAAESGVSLTADLDAAPGPIRLIWINSPANPSGQVLTADQMGALLAYARKVGAVVASDECYLTLPWYGQPTSIMSVCAGNYDGVISVHSLSKRSNLAGYRAGFVAGDPEIVSELLAVRKHAGMIMPDPVQAAMIVALEDETHVDEQRQRYARRRAVLLEAVTGAGFQVHHSQAGLYLWATRGADCWETVDWFAERGILVAPGSFYGPAGQHYVRIALTGTDERITAAGKRLSAV